MPRDPEREPLLGSPTGHPNPTSSTFNSPPPPPPPGTLPQPVLIIPRPPHPRRRAPPRKLQTLTRLISLVLPFLLLYLTYLLLTYLNVTSPSTLFLTHLPYPEWPFPPTSSPDTPLTLSDYEDIAITYPSAERARAWSEYYTSGPHLGGRNYTQAKWTEARLRERGWETEIVAYDIYVNYPVGHRLALLEKKGDGEGEGEVVYEAGLEEPVLEEDRTSGLVDRVPTFHGYSANGNVTGPLVFANYGTFADYEKLIAHNITIEGSIVIVRYGGVFRGLKVKRAQDLGALGVIIYSDPGDDFGITPEKGYEEYPKGPARNSGSVQRGSVQFLSLGPGDPTTPGYPSLPGAPRKDPHATTPKIPSLPISYNDAIPLLKALNEYGPSSADLGWKLGGLAHKGVKYSIGPTPPNLVVNLFNEQDYKITPMWDVIARIPGTLGSTEGVVVAGNHRDAWIAGGAGDPNSGSAALLEVAGALGEMRKRGWKPTRDIILASWDGEEYGLLGSTEWVEDHKEYLSENAVAYINLDIGAVGSHFRVSANPILNGLLREAAGRVKVKGPKAREAWLKKKLGRHVTAEEAEVAVIPEEIYVSDIWDGRIATLGSGSDYTAFQDFLGIPCSDMAFVNDIGDSVWMYHSNFDSFDWMQKYGDRGFHFHETAAKVWALMVTMLASRDVIPFNVTEYAVSLEGYLEGIQRGKGGQDTPHPVGTLAEFSEKGVEGVGLEIGVNGGGMLDGYGNPRGFAYTPPSEEVLNAMRVHNGVGKHHPPEEKPFDPTPLPSHLSKLTAHTVLLHKHISHLLHLRDEILAQGPPPSNGSPYSPLAALARMRSKLQRMKLWREISRANGVLRRFDRMWVDEAGLGGGRGWFRHVVFAPGRWTGYAGVVLPGLGEAWEDGDVLGWKGWRGRVGKCVERAVGLVRTVV